ncbi:LOW QUALITY PROTEIN: VPS35 endosomal protein-sorting factor-like [Dermatophagoides farinae]|uniref:LOW QUALITY PROTEIN: VPS35 endosomal protein-sorting factor-like n=1 Tax=Dermatophagoides farinae TaxID=6954 RepID=UPI003F5EAF29
MNSYLISKNKITVAKPCKFSLVRDHPLSVMLLDSEIDSSLINGQNGDKKPLGKTNSIETKLVTTTWNGLDPLSAAISSSAEDENSIVNEDESVLKFGKEKNVYIGSDFNHWQSFRTKILNKFNTADKLTIRSSFQFDKGTLSTPNVSQKVRTRLEQLDEMEEGSINEMHDLSQQEYIKRIEEMNVAIKNAWESDQRVKALKIVIQCTKQLSSINVMHFYPSKFVLITDILDNFGELVYDRIEKKIHNQIEDAKETCLNWFYKISSIRELLPRFYIECSVLQIYSFLITRENQREEYERILLRLTRMTRGIGDPLVSIYCRVYLCRIVIKLFPESKKIFLQNIYDIIDNVDQLTCHYVRDSLMAQNIEYPLYYSLFHPAMDWIFNCLFYKGSNYDNILKYFRNKIEFFKNTSCSAFVLSSMIMSFPPSFIAQNLANLVTLIKNIYHNNQIEDQASKGCDYPKYLLVKNIGESLVHEDDFIEKYSVDKNLLFVDLWTLCRNVEQPRKEFLSCLETWSEIIAKYSSVEHINKLLGEIIQNITANNREPYDNVQQLLQILQKIIMNGSKRIGYEQFFSMNNLLPFLDLFKKEAIKIDAYKLIVSSYNKNCSVIDDSRMNDAPDPVILNAMTYLCKLIHDSIDSLTLEDEKRQISTLIIGFIRRVSYKQQQDLEARLNFYIESRANFSNLDPVLSFIVHQVNTLAMDAYRFVNGRHTKKTISFVNACMAFSYITIPSMYDIFLRLQLYLSSSHVALVNGCLPQTDAFIKFTITLIRQLPPYSESFDGKLYSNDEFLHSYSSQLLSTLIVVPDNPELGILYLFKGLYNVLKEFRFESNSNYKLLIWMNMAKYLATCIQDNYPYHVDRLDSNDSLYAQDEEFIKEVETYFDIIFQESLDMFKKFQHDFSVKQQCNIALDFINLIINFGNIQKMSHVINQLWKWTCKTLAKHNFHCFDHKMKSIYNYLGKTVDIQLKMN